MKTLELNELTLVEMTHDEKNESNGGFLPLAVIYTAWGVMAACSLVAAAFQKRLDKYEDKNH